MHLLLWLSNFFLSHKDSSGKNNNTKNNKYITIERSVVQETVTSTCVFTSLHCSCHFAAWCWYVFASVLFEQKSTAHCVFDKAPSRNYRADQQKSIVLRQIVHIHFICTKKVQSTSTIFPPSSCTENGWSCNSSDDWSDQSHQ